MSRQRIILAGGTGFLGANLLPVLRRAGYEIIVLTRNPSRFHDEEEGVSYCRWNGQTREAWADCLSGAKAVVNLAGSTINCRMSKANKKRIVDSRIDSTRALCSAAREAMPAPEVFVQCSAVGFYGNKETPQEETSPPGNGFLAKTCSAWEDAFRAFELESTRSVLLRMGIVLGTEGGALPLLVKTTRLFLGGRAGHGKQYMSWIHQEDVNRVFLETIENRTMEGVYNVTSPGIVTNGRFMKVLRALLSRPWSPPVPAPLLKLGGYLLGLNTELSLSGQRAVPTRLQAAEFEFEYPELDCALASLLVSPERNQERMEP